MSRTVPLRTALLLVAAAAFACSPRPSGSPPRVAVTVARAERRAVPYQLGATGAVETIRAPIGGRTGSLTVREGALVRPSDPTPLVTINQLRPILVRFAVPSSNLPALRRYGDRPLKVLAQPGEGGTGPIEGVLAFMDNHVDSITGTVLLKGRFVNGNGQLWPGEFVDVNLVLAVEPDALVVPAQAVMSSQQGTYVFIVNSDGSASQQTVTVARTVDSLAVIAQGVTPGALVVTDGQLRLTPNARVDIPGGLGSESAAGSIRGVFPGCSA